MATMGSSRAHPIWVPTASLQHLLSPSPYCAPATPTSFPSNKARMLLPQGLWTCCSLCLGHPSLALPSTLSFSFILRSPRSLEPPQVCPSLLRLP